jgi:hypothetical protein
MNLADGSTGFRPSGYPLEIESDVREAREVICKLYGWPQTFVVQRGAS